MDFFTSGKRERWNGNESIAECACLPAGRDCGVENIEDEQGDVVMDKEQMKQRTKEFALRVIRLVESLPTGQTARVIGNQLIRSGTSVGANYRAACRVKSMADFISKMGTV